MIICVAGGLFLWLDYGVPKGGIIITTANAIGVSIYLCLLYLKSNNVSLSKQPCEENKKLQHRIDKTKENVTFTQVELLLSLLCIGSSPITMIAAKGINKVIKLLDLLDKHIKEQKCGHSAEELLQEYENLTTA